MATQAVENSVTHLTEIEITDAELVQLRTMDDLDAADILDARARRLEDSARRSFVELGLICREVSERALWAKLASPATGTYFHSMDAWMASALNVSRPSAYAAWKALDRLKEVPVDDVREMPRMNALTLSTLSTAAQRDPEVIALAKSSKTSAEFAQGVKERHPDQHIEVRRAAVVKLEESAKTVLEEAVTVCMWAYELDTREQAFEQLAAYFLEGSCEREDIAGVMDNRQAYNRAIGRDGRAHA